MDLTQAYFDLVSNHFNVPEEDLRNLVENFITPAKLKNVLIKRRLKDLSEEETTNLRLLLEQLRSIIQKTREMELNTQAQNYDNELSEDNNGKSDSLTRSRKVKTLEEEPLGVKRGKRRTYSFMYHPGNLSLDEIKASIWRSRHSW